MLKDGLNRMEGVAAVGIHLEYWCRQVCCISYEELRDYIHCALASPGLRRPELLLCCWQVGILFSSMLKLITRHQWAAAANSALLNH